MAKYAQYEPAKIGNNSLQHSLRLETQEVQEDTFRTQAIYEDEMLVDEGETRQGQAEDLLHDGQGQDIGLLGSCKLEKREVSEK